MEPNKSLLTSKTVISVIVMAVIAIAGIRGYKPDPQWTVVKDKPDGTTIGEFKDGVQTGVRAEDAPTGSVIYKGEAAAAVQTQGVVEKVAGAAVAVCGFLAILFRKNATEQITKVLPGRDD